MANNGLVTSGTLRNSHFFCFWQEVGQDINGNYSNINWQAGVYTGTDSAHDYWYTNAVKINSVYVNGQNVGSGTWSNIGLDGGGNHQLLSGSVRVYHNSDGSKSFNISINGWLYGYGDTSGSKDFTLNTIPRSAKINSFSGNKVEGNFSVTYTGYSSSFNHKLRLSFPYVGVIQYINNYSSGSTFTLDSFG